MEIQFDVSAFAVKHQKEKDLTRMILIARIFEYDKFLGIDVKLLARDPLYYNNQFDRLYEMNFYELEDLEKDMHESVQLYGDILNKYFKV